MNQTFAEWRPRFRRELEEELTGNILPFWQRHVIDREHGGFHGALTNDLQIHDEEPRSAVLTARILWTYSLAYRKYSVPAYLETARWAYETLTRVFWDSQYGGVFWTVDAAGRPMADRKHHYAQAFAIYGLTEFVRATGETPGLELAKQLFELLERHAFEPEHGGYLEGSNRAWGTLADMSLSASDMNCRKSMNTLLHMLEGYSNLMRVWDEPRLKSQHRRLLDVFLTQVVDSRTGHLRLFFDDDWNSLADHFSFGHDIEASWLLCEAAELQKDPDLLERTRSVAVRIADLTLREGVDSDGGLLSEAGPKGLTDDRKIWWSQAEAVVGFYNAYQLSGREEFAQASRRNWEFIRENLVDRENGDWFKLLFRDRRKDPARYKSGPWECPYHHSRMCFEMAERLGK